MNLCQTESRWIFYFQQMFVSFPLQFSMRSVSHIIEHYSTYDFFELPILVPHHHAPKVQHFTASVTSWRFTWNLVTLSQIIQAPVFFPSRNGAAYLEDGIPGRMGKWLITMVHGS